MATGTATDFQIFPEQFFGGVTEVLEQNGNAFNEASQGALRLIPRLHRGDFSEESFIKNISTLITRRDNTSIAAAVDSPLTQEEWTRIKLNRKIGPVANTLDSFKKIQQSPEMLSLMVGRQSGVGINLDWLNTLLIAVESALQGVALLNAGPTAATITHRDLVTALALFGDASDRIVAWIMHSKVFFDLVDQAIVDNIFQVGSISIVAGTTPTLGRPTIITDSPALLTAGVPDTFHTLGLVADAGVAMESEERDIVSDTITGQENLILRIQGEYAFTVGVKGFSWDEAGAGVNPTDAALGTPANWIDQMDDVKSLAGVRLTTN